MTFQIPPLDELKWIAVDLDGTLAESVWPDPGIGDPIKVNVAKLREAVRKGYKVVIHTARPWSDYELIEAWCELHDIPVRRIQCGKILAALYIDDRGRHESESTWTP